MPVLRGETTSPWRKPHGPCERVKLQVTSIQAGAAPQHTHRPLAQPSSPATWGTVISCDRRGQAVTVTQFPLWSEDLFHRPPCLMRQIFYPVLQDKKRGKLWWFPWWIMLVSIFFSLFLWSHAAHFEWQGPTVSAVINPHNQEYLLGNMLSCPW